MAESTDNSHARILGAVAAPIVRFFHKTWQIRVVDTARVGEGVRHGEDPSIIAFWHRHILTMMAEYRAYHVCVPVSQSKDGEYVAQVMARFGQISVRGSSSTGAARMLREWVLRAKEGWSPIITPDGPRGPRYSISPGVSMLARRSGLPVYPVGLAVRHAWILGSWDRFVVPKPFTRIVIVFWNAVTAEDYPRREPFCLALERGLWEATEEAERLLATDADSYLPA